VGGVQVLFVHGALVRDAGWWWHRMVAPLAAVGLDTAAVELPSCVAEPRGDLHADGDAVRAAVAAAGQPVVLVGHSYGGTVVTDAGTSPGVEHLVYVTSVLADRQHPHASFFGPEPPPWVRPAPDGTLELVPDRLRELFFADCDEGTFAAAADRSARQSALALSQPPREVAWRTVPSTYVVCADDRAVPADFQRRLAGQAGGVVEVPTGHHPFLSRPELLAGVIRRALD
jgi:pimeloyl-ACP methyl ester carboxylesterase